MTEQNQTPDTADSEDAEGHRLLRDDPKDDDTEGHGHARGAEDDSRDDDTEGHRTRTWG